VLPAVFPGSFSPTTTSVSPAACQHIIDSLKDGGTCGMVIDEGVLFHTTTGAFRQTKRKLLDECDLWAVVSLPANVFANAGAGSKTNLLFFTKGRSTERIWYYDVSDVHVTKSKPLTAAHFEDFFARLALPADDPGRESQRSWWRDVTSIREASYDMRAVNPQAPDRVDSRSVDELTAVIRDAQETIIAGLARLK
jgi:type I restriction enzyme M protein